MKISIIVVNYRNSADTFQCLKAIIENTELCKEKFEVILVDNGSNDGSFDKVKSFFPKVVILVLNRNLGFAGANNLGINHSLKEKADYVFLLNNDAYLNKDTIPQILQVFSSDHSIGIVGATVLCYVNPCVIDNMGANINYFTGISQFVANGKLFRKNQPDIDVDYVCGAAMMIKREVIERTGLLPEQYFLYGEEMDYCVNANKNGFRIVCSGKSTILHKGSSTIGKFLGIKNYYFHRNRIIFLRLRGKPYQFLFAVGHSFLAILPYYLFRYTIQSRSKPREGLSELASFLSGIFDGIRFKTGYTKKIE